MDDMQQQFGVNISYKLEWLAKETEFAFRRGEIESFFVRGTPKELYALLHAYREASKIENLIILHLKLNLGRMNISNMSSWCWF